MAADSGARRFGVRSDRFDVVIVGAGSAGAVLAARLSQAPRRRVLLLEAGPDHDQAGTPPEIASPNFFVGLGAPGRIWPNLQAIRMPGQEPSLYLRGRGVGGSSAVNAMMAIRGIPDDYDRWADEFGCDGWSWNDLEPVFAAVEGATIPMTRVDDGDRAPFDQAVERAAVALGYGSCFDYHAPGATGVSRVALTIRDGRRVSTNDAYLEDARGRPNLEVRGDVVVDRVALDGRRARGVMTVGGEEIEAGEVVVSAGAIHSPAILLRSGIGPDAGLPVGANLIDHAMTGGFELALNDRGRARNPAVPVVNSVLRYTSGLADAGVNDMQMVWFTALGATREAMTGARLLAAVMRVYSRGRVTLRSNDPNTDPAVEFNLLGDERDRIRLRDGVRRVIELLRHPQIAEVADAVTVPGVSVDALESDEAIDAWLDAAAGDYVHAVGTCRMGGPGDPNAVVDPMCRVIGYEGLRVCDASVMPDIPRANTHLTTVAIAEALAKQYARRPM